MLVNKKINDMITWKAGMAFGSMNEFRTIVREYGIKERRVVYFVTNDGDRCQVKCDKG